MKTKKLYPISEGAFEIMYFDRDALIVTIAVAGSQDTDKIELDHEDVLFGALQLGWIDSYIYPESEGGHYLVEENGENTRFPRWWESITGTDLDQVFSRAISERAKYLIEQAADELVAA